MANLNKAPKYDCRCVECLTSISLRYCPKADKELDTEKLRAIIKELDKVFDFASPVSEGCGYQFFDSNIEKVNIIYKKALEVIKKWSD